MIIIMMIIIVMIAKRVRAAFGQDRHTVSPAGHTTLRRRPFEVVCLRRRQSVILWTFDISALHWHAEEELAIANSESLVA